MASITLTTKPTPQTNIATVVSFRKYQKYVRPAADYQAGNRNIPPLPPRAPSVARGEPDT